MGELNWYWLRLSELEDRLWGLRRATDDVHSFEDRLRGLWDDSAAQEIRGRFVTPLHEEHRAACAALLVQLRELHHMHDQLGRLHTHSARMAELSTSITDALLDVSHELRRAGQEQERSLVLSGQVRQAVIDVERLLLSAERAGT